MKLPYFIERFTFNDAFRLSEREDSDVKFDNRCCLCGHKLQIYYTSNEQWGVCLNCEFYGNPITHLAKKLDIPINDAVYIVNKNRNIYIERNKLEYWLHLATASSRFMETFNNLSTVNRYVGSNKALENLGLEIPKQSSNLDHLIRITTKRELRKQLTGYKIRMSSENMDELSLIYVLKDAPCHPTGFVLVSGEGNYPGDYSYHPIVKNDYNCGFIFHDNILKRPDLYFISDLPLFLKLQSRNVSLDGSLLPIIGYLEENSFLTQYKSIRWDIFRKHRKTIWAPVHRKTGVITAKTVNAKVTPVSPSNNLLDNVQKWINTLDNTELMIKLTNTAVAWPAAVCRIIYGQDNIYDSESFIEDLRLSRMEKNKLLSIATPEVKRKLKQVFQTVVSGDTALISERKYLEQSGGWHLVQKVTGELERVSDVICHIQTIISLPKINKIYYKLLVTHKQDSIILLLTDLEFESKLISTVQKTVINKFLRLGTISVSSKIFKQLTLKFSSPDHQVIHQGCGYNQTNNTYVLPKLQFSHGSPFFVETTMPGLTPARKLTKAVYESKYDTRIFQMDMEYTRQAILLLSTVLCNLFSRSVTPTTPGTLLITDTPENYLPLLEDILPIVRREHLSMLPQYDKFHKWPVVLVKQDLDDQEIRTRTSARIVSNLFCQVPAHFGFARTIMGNFNMLLLDNRYEISRYASGINSQLNTVFLQGMKELSAMHFTATRGTNYYFDIFSECYRVLTELTDFPAINTSDRFIAAGSDLPPVLFVDMLKFMGLLENMKKNPAYEINSNNKMVFSRAYFRKIMTRLLNNYTEYKIYNILDKTDANLIVSTKHQTFSIDLNWVLERLQKADSIYKLYEQCQDFT